MNLRKARQNNKKEVYSREKDTGARRFDPRRIRCLCKKAFSGLYDVVYPSENCRFSSYIIRNLADWADVLGGKSKEEILGI